MTMVGGEQRTVRIQAFFKTGDLLIATAPVVEFGMDCDVVHDEHDLKQLLDLHWQQNTIRLAARARYEDVISLVSSLGHDGRSYRREASQRLRAIVSEVSSAPRVTAAAKRHPRFGCIPRLALDPTINDESGEAWNFSIPAMRKNAEALIDHGQPHLLKGSLMCTALSHLQNLNKNRRDPKVIEKELVEARIHLSWCCLIYWKQLDGGAYCSTNIQR